MLLQVKLRLALIFFCEHIQQQPFFEIPLLLYLVRLTTQQIRGVSHILRLSFSLAETSLEFILRHILLTLLSALQNLFLSLNPQIPENNGHADADQKGGKKKKTP